MKPFVFLKLPLVILALGGALILVPQARGQSEIAPDHFDGTDSWAAAASAKVATAKAKSNSAPTTLQAQNNKAAAPSLQPVAARNVTESSRSYAIAADKKRKPVAGKQDN
jgi:hypothetical protein